MQYLPPFNNKAVGKNRNVGWEECQVVGNYIDPCLVQHLWILLFSLAITRVAKCQQTFQKFFKNINQ